MENVLVVGASGELGSSVIKKLKGKGRQFILHYHSNKSAVDDLAKHLEQSELLLTVNADLALESSVKEMIERIPFSIDTIIFAQGIAGSTLLTETNLDDMDQMYHIHLKSVMMISKAFLPEMVTKKSGNIVVVSSIWGEIGASNEVVYSSMKGAQNAFVKSLAKEVGPSQVRVNAIAPGFVDTQMNAHISQEEVEQFIEQIPLSRVALVDEVASAIDFLISEQSSYINGHILRVNGGMY
ncbi:elongation factor P 5-aminopentanone reductase [Halalkalibacillus halophilus]|uniref:elongation factor P 5-aminopentanone reductase n=1 Tax=Halalkalibacillus halophilus TaxID=392827 RepID=UPI0004059721|nr:SDR family oxidoreductase [Halalkalibacillus halophilus]